MGMFNKINRTPDDGTRRLPDEPLDGSYARTLPPLQRVLIRVFVSELRKMLDERDVERRQEFERVAADKVREMLPGLPWGGADPSAQRAEIDGSQATGVDRGGRFTPPEYRDRTEQDG